jgi:ribose-phosphate pyrophosphokinase
MKNPKKPKKTNNSTIVYSGRASISLAKSVAKELGIRLGKFRIKKFADSEPWFCVYDGKKVTGKNVYIIQPTSEYAPTTYFDLFGMIDALKRQKPKRIVIVMTFMGFRRQERAVKKGEAIMADLMAKFIATAGATDVILCDPHSPKTVGYFKKYGVKVHLIDPNPIFANKLANTDLSKCAVMNPDKGRKTAARELAKLLNLPLVSAKKKRPAHDQAQCTGIKTRRSLRGLTIIIREDEVSTARTMVHTVEKLIQAGVKSVIIVATHAVLVAESIWDISAVKKIRKIYFTDSIYLFWEKREDKFVILPLGPAIADLIRKLEAK